MMQHESPRYGGVRGRRKMPTACPRCKQVQPSGREAFLHCRRTGVPGRPRKVIPVEQVASAAGPLDVECA